MGLFFQNETGNPPPKPTPQPAPAPAPQSAKDPWEPSSIFVPYSQFVQTLGANPDVEGLEVRDATMDRQVRPDGEGHFMRVYLKCSDRRRPPEKFEDVLVQLTLLRFLHDDVSQDEYWERRRKFGVGSGYGLEDYREVDTSIRLVPMTVNQHHGMEFEDGVWRFDAAMSVPLDELTWIKDGTYIVGLDIGGAKLSRDARMEAYPFFEETNDENEDAYIPSGYSMAEPEPEPAPASAPEPELTPEPEPMPKPEPEPAPAPASVPTGAKTPKNPDTRDYFDNVSDIERYISLGSDPRIRDMRMEYYEVDVEPTELIFRVAVNSKNPLPVGEKITVWCNCTVTSEVKKLIGKKVYDIIVDGYRPSPFKDARIKVRDDYEYDDAYGYILELVFGSNDLRMNPIPGFYNVKFDVMTAEYLRKGRVLFNRFQLDAFE
ncbi:MAG: hypothetical protein E7474_03455 [Ruminococcaceae bacterium]|nr:hypothetical protein [Oscillospiraceae bacterium]